MPALLLAIAGAVNDTAVTRRSIIRSLMLLTKGQARKAGRVTEEAITALAKITLGESERAVADEIVEGLFDLISLNHEEIHLVIGQALAAISTQKLLIEPWDETNVCVGRLPAVSAVAAEGADIEAMFDPSFPQDKLPMMARILRKICVDWIPNGSKMQRMGACTWLLGIVKFAGDSSIVSASVGKIQNAFSRALTDSHQFTQEVASKGMALVFDQGDKKAQEQLMKNLMRTFNVGRRHVQGDTEVQLGESGEFSTYKELCSVANDIGQPDLVYKFLDLASHHSIWNSRLGAAYSLGSIVAANKQLAPHLGSLIPKLFRYQHDSNPKIKDAMKAMWSTLVTNPKETINNHFNAIALDLIKCLTGRQMRERHASCMAACTLLQGRDYEQVAPFMEEFWCTNFKTLDDMNDLVRTAAQDLAKGLTNLAIRLSNPRLTKPENVDAFLQVLLPILLEKGIVSRVKEVQAVSINALLKVAQVAGNHLRPHLPGLVVRLMEGMSSLEPRVFSYMQYHTSSMNMTDEQLESLRLTLANTSPLADALHSCLTLVNAETIKGVLVGVSGVMRNGVGLPTMTAASKFIVGLIQRHPAELVQEHIGPAMTALSANLGNHSPSIRKTYASCLGYCCKVAKAKKVRKFVNKLVDMYMDSDSSDVLREVSGLATRSVSRIAPDSARANAVVLVPIAFVAQHDEIEAVKTVWKSSWDEMVTGDETGAELHTHEIVILCEKLFESNAWRHRRVALLSLARLCELTKLGVAAEIPKILAILLPALPGSVWEGKEVLFEALLSLSKHCYARLTGQQVTLVMQAVQTQCGRKQSLVQGVTGEYLVKAFHCLGELGELFLHSSMFGLAVPAMTAIITKEEQEVEKGDERTRDDDKKDSLLMAAVFSCLGRLWPRQEIREGRGEGIKSLSEGWQAEQSKHASWVVRVFADGLQGGLSWNVRVALLNSLHTFFETVHMGDQSLVDVASVNTLISCVIPHMADNKYATVRKDCVKMISVLCKRKEGFALLVDSPCRSLLESTLIAMASDSDPSVLREMEQVKPILVLLRDAKPIQNKQEGGTQYQPMDDIEGDM